MTVKKNDSTGALVAVIAALEPLNDTDRHWVIQSAASKFTLTVQTAAGGAQSGAATPSITTAPAAGAAPTDVQAAITKKDSRAFIRIKKPVTDVQRVACIGYYLVQTSGQQGFTSKALATAHTDSGGSKINMPRALDNATRRAKYLSNRGPREKQLTTLGEDVVNALPDQATVKIIESAAKRGHGGKKGRKTKAVKRS